MATENDYGQELMTWSFSEFVQYERSRGWYIGAIIIMALLLLYSVLVANFLFALIVLITAIILFLRSSNEAKEIKFSIFEDGIMVGEKFYNYKEIQNFWLIYEPPVVKNLYFSFGSILLPRVQIPLQDRNPVKVRQILLKYLNEDLTKENEPFSDAMSRLLKL
ncbi:MAG: hypothetical protein WC480_02100 [Patescibacteria group bacterium]